MSEIFVFGSNLAGRHGAGAAKSAVQQYGAIYGQGIGLQGSSYAIPTKGHTIETLPLSEIKIHVDVFIEFATNHPLLFFRLTPIGCGLAGYVPKDIAPMFVNAPTNVQLPWEFQQVIGGN